MRKSLNVLQACHMAYSEINELAVYSSTGNPLPSDLKLMLSMLNNQPFQVAFEGIHAIQVEKGLSLFDMITFLHELVLQINYPPPVTQTRGQQQARDERQLPESVSHLSRWVGFVFAVFTR